VRLTVEAVAAEVTIKMAPQLHYHHLHQELPVKVMLVEMVTQVARMQAVVVVAQVAQVQPQILLKQVLAALGCHIQLQELLLLTQVAEAVQHAAAA
jgi:hypothetical protein